MGKCVFGVCADSEGPDHPVHRAVWLQHLLSAYNVFDTVGTSIYIVLDKSLSGWAASQLI